jgi:hypothetical protein
MAAAGGKLFLFGGRAGARTLFNDLHVFDPAAAAWHPVTTSGPGPESRDFHSFVAVGNRWLVLFGGSHEIGATSKFFNDVWILDSAAPPVWHQLAVSGTLPTPRWNHAAAVRGEMIYVFGGTCDGDDTNDLWQLRLSGLPAAAAAATTPPAVSATSTPAAPPPAQPAAPVAAAPSNPVPAARTTTPTTAPRGPVPPKSVVAAAGSSSALPVVAPTLNYTVAHPAPAPTPVIATPVVPTAAPRDYEGMQARFLAEVTALVGSLRTEACSVDTERAQLAAERAVLEKARADHAALVDLQQRELADLQKVCVCLLINTFSLFSTKGKKKFLTSSLYYYCTAAQGRN